MSETITGCPVRTDFDPLNEAFLADPYAVASLVREESPVFYAPGLDMWVVTRMADVEAVFTDPETFSGRLVQDPIFALCPAARTVLAEGFDPLPVMSNNVPPDHGRVRVHTTKGFSNRRMAALEPSVRRRAEGYVERMIEAGPPAEFVQGLAFPLPAYTVFELIGFPESDAEQLKQWCGRRKLFSWGHPSEDEQVDIATDMLSYWRYCQAFVAERQAERAAGTHRDDFVSELLDAHDADPADLTLDEVKSIVYGLSFAGHEAVTNLLGNTVRCLLGRPEVWAEVIADPQLIPAAVEEVLRYDSSQISWRRITTRPTTVGGVDLPAGAKILLLFASANHDPARFADPDTFDLHRPTARHHISFGKGIHFCLGSAMARMEARVVVDVLARRLPSLRLVEPQALRVHPNVQFRGPEELWLTWNAGGRGVNVTLTFDNGPTPGVTDEVLDVLTARGVPATFFVIAQRLRDGRARRCAERAKVEGHRVGNHTLTHTVLLGEAPIEVALGEVDEAERLLGDLAEDPPLFRPYGQGGTIDHRLVGPGVLAHLRARRYTCVLWNCVPRDWVDQDGWVDRCVEQVRSVDWPVIAVHDVPGAVLPRLPELLDRLDGLGATYTQETPDACTPLRAGVPTAAIALLDPADA